MTQSESMSYTSFFLTCLVELLTENSIKKSKLSYYFVAIKIYYAFTSVIMRHNSPLHKGILLA